MTEPFIIPFPSFGVDETGFLTFAQESSQIPFDVKRIYWIYKAPEGKERGNHAHKKGEQVLIAICGKVEIDLESPNGEKSKFSLKTPDCGLYLPGNYWRKVKLKEGAVLVSLASTFFDKDNYICDYNSFKNGL